MTLYQLFYLAPIDLVLKDFNKLVKIFRLEKSKNCILFFIITLPFGSKQDKQMRKFKQRYKMKFSIQLFYYIFHIVKF